MTSFGGTTCSLDVTIRGLNVTRRDWQIWLIALAFLAKVLVPAGYMLAASYDGTGLPQIVICTGNGARLVTLDKDGHPVEKDTEKSNGPCPFATPTAVVLSTPPGLPSTPRFPVIWTRELPATTVAAAVTHSWRARAPPSDFLA